jgi:hypothetical protein
MAVRNASFKLDGTLTPRRSYVLRIAFSGQKVPLDVPILVSPSNTANLLILRLD